jgi:peptide/nickel transport system substrate-binding protein
MRQAVGLRFGALAIAGALTLGMPADAGAETVLRVGMTLADIPVTTSQPNQGAEGWRFIGATLYDSLVNWDLSSADKASKIIPGLALSWAADEADRRRWTFKLRQGVKFHDGTPFNAEAVVWNLVKLTDTKASHYDAAQVAQTFGRMNGVSSFRAIDEHTVELVTKEPDALIPYYFARIFMASPTQWEKVGRSWAKFAEAPAGTGPWKLAKLIPRERAELVKNTEYWDKNRIPKIDRMVLLPIPDAVNRTSAMLAGQLDWIEAPAPDLIPALKAAGMQIVTNAYPHTWPYWLSRTPDSPFNDIRIRKAFNLAIDREAIVSLLGGFAKPAVAQFTPGHPWFGNPSFTVKYDPEAAKKLMAEAGYTPAKPLRFKALVTAAGSGQMQPLPMNEFVQASLREVGFDMQLEVIEWNTMTTRRAAGAQAPENKGIYAHNNSWAWWDPDFGIVNLLDSRKAAPAGLNWMNVRKPEFDALCDEIRNEFDPVKQDALVAKLHTAMVDDATWVWVVHDMNPRALSPRVKGFVQAQHWIQDFSPVTIGR